MGKRSHRTLVQDALDQLESAIDEIGALDTARQLREHAEAVELEAVSAARRAGVSWSQLGRVYGLTKQGAQQRFRDAVSGKPKKHPEPPENPPAD